MHAGATIRLLRTGAGLGLRDLAQRIGVSSAYLSRVENGHDPAPTADRLEAIASELGIPSSLLLDLAGRLSPFLSAYLAETPSAGAFFTEIAARKLDDTQLARIRRFIAEEIGPAPIERVQPATTPVAPLFAADRVVLNLNNARISEVLDLVAAKLAPEPKRAPDLAAALHASESSSPGAIGGGLLLAQCFAPKLPPAAALVTLAKSPRVATPDHAPLRVVIGLRNSDRGGAHLALLAQLTRLARHGAVDKIHAARTAKQALDVIRQLEAAF